MPTAVMRPYQLCFAYRKSAMSDSPPCIARLQIQANAAIRQKPIGALPSGVRPVQTTRSAMVKKSDGPE